MSVSADPLVTVDVAALWRLLAHAGVDRGVTMRQVARETGLSPMLLTTIKKAARDGRAYSPSATTVLSLCRWLNLDDLRPVTIVRGEPF